MAAPLVAKYICMQNLAAAMGSEKGEQEDQDDSRSLSTASFCGDGVAAAVGDEGCSESCVAGAESDASRESAWASPSIAVVSWDVCDIFESDHEELTLRGDIAPPRAGPNLEGLTDWGNLPTPPSFRFPQPLGVDMPDFHYSAVGKITSGCKGVPS